MPEIQIVGGSYQGRSKNVNAQRCVNFFPYPDPTGKKTLYLQGTPGLLEYYDFESVAGTVPVRGLHTFNDVLYAVLGNTLYKLSGTFKTGLTATNLGTLLTSSGYVWMADNRTELMLVDGTDGYVLESDGTTFGAIADADFPTPTSLAYQDGYFIVTKDASDSVYISASLDGLTWSATDFKTAGAQPDKALAVFSHNNTIFVIGERSTELWYNSGAADFPLDLVPGGVLQFGTAAAASVASSKTGDLFWLGDDYLVRQFRGLQPQVITPPQVAFQFESYTTISDAIGFVFHIEKQVFYTLTFPTEKKTWQYNAASGFWNEWNSWPNNDKHRANCFVFFDNKNLVGDYGNGKVYYLDMDTFEDDGNAIIAYRTSQVVEANRRNVFHNTLEVEFEAGVGLATGQGNDPQAMLSWSDDGGHVWSNEHWRDIGKIGKYKNRARWHKLGHSRERIYKVGISDPVKRVIISANLDAGVGSS